MIDSIASTLLHDMARIGRYAWPLLLMGVIFVLSAQPDLNSGLGTVDLVGRKVVHMTEYGVLFWLWARATGRPALAAVIALVYAATDEYHQTFVAGRHGSPVDWVIDGAGIAIAAAVWRRRSVRHVTV